MRYRAGAALIWAVAGGAAQAQDDWNMREDDAPLTSAQMQHDIVGRQLVFYDGGISDYGPEGVYSYTYDGGGTAFGAYRMQQDGVICVAFANGFDRCDMFVRSGGRLVVITQKGDRFPVRP